MKNIRAMNDGLATGPPIIKISTRISEWLVSRQVKMGHLSPHGGILVRLHNDQKQLYQQAHPLPRNS